VIFYYLREKINGLGRMKIALSQLNYHIGNYFENTTRIAFEIKRAQQFQVDLIIFSELAVDKIFITCA
jgi:predicted amidohydrolase